MDVQIDDYGPPHDSLALQHPNRDRDIVDEAESLAVIGKRVMKPSS